MKRTIVLLLLIFYLPLNKQCFAQDHSLKQITFSDSTHDGYPYWSPDGKYIIYSSGTRSGCNTLRIPSEGGQPEKITDSFAQHARWSPDGEYIVFDGYDGKLIQIVPSCGGKPIRIDPDSIVVINSGMPSWSPDSKHIAFTSIGMIYILDIASGECTEVFHREGKISVAFDWTPDGNYFLADVRDTINRSETDIWLVPVNKGQARQLTFLSGRQVKPDISPDGSMILFTSDHGGNADLWIMSIDGGDPVQITYYAGEGSNPGYDIEASWSPDGQKIAFSSTRTGYWAIWVMDPDMDIIRSKLTI